jgi:hypothetical protein
VTDPGQPPPKAGDFTIARSKALAPLLVLFGLTVLALVLVIVNATPLIPPDGAPADKAFGPADFANLFTATEPIAATGPIAGSASGLTFPVPAPPFSDGIFPCSDCHADFEADPERRELGMHSEIVFEHDAEHRWCLDCHDVVDRDQLRLASGARVPFTESYRLCGQCHGTQFRDWRTGIHGKRTGYWNGPTRYLLCVHCHNPHSPRFESLEPLPPPVRPQFLNADARQVAAMKPAGKEKHDNTTH